MRDLRHHQSEWAGPGDHDHIVELDVASIDGMNGAGERLDDRGVFNRDAVGNSMNDGSGGKRIPTRVFRRPLTYLPCSASYRFSNPSVRS